MEKNKFSFSNLKFDLPAALVVFFVALPLCLGISIASTSYEAGAGVKEFAGAAFPGLISGFIGGIIVGFFSGSRFGVSGPAAGLITIVASAIVSFGGFEKGFSLFLLAVVLAGIMQVIFGFLKGGFLAYYFPSAVIKGMLAGIGITIFLKEVPHFFGYDKDAEGEMGFFQADGHNTFSELYYMLDGVHWGALIVGAIALVILMLWGTKVIKKNKVLGMIPGPLLAIIATVLISYGFIGNELLEISDSHLVKVPVAESTQEFFSFFRFPDWAGLTDHRVWGIAITIALVASIETLLCVEATDKLDPDKGQTPLNRELKAQGIGNIVSGLIGGLPITQVIVRSSANIDSGAKSKVSAIVHGVLIVVCIVSIPSLLNTIPRAALAAVLLLIGYKLANPKQLKAMYVKGWDQLIPFIITIVAILFTNLLVGIGIGLAVAFLTILYKNFKMDYFVNDDHDIHNGKVHLTLSQHVTFLNKASILSTLDAIPENTEVTLDMSHTLDIDFDITEALNDFQERAKDKNITVEILQQPSLKTHEGGLKTIFKKKVK